MQKGILKLWLADYRFWVFLFFIVRLYHITNPPLEVAHNWRQTTVTMAARNFVETDNNVLYPRVDIAGEKTGITGMEFPLLNYLIYLLSLVFGYAHWYGRLITLIVSSFGLIYFNRLLGRYFDEKLSFHASMILLFSVWFSYSRKVMPDTFSMSLVLMGIYYGSRYIEQSRSLDLCLYLLCLLTGLLSKLPSAYLGALLPVLVAWRKPSFKVVLPFTLTTLTVAGIVAWYYFSWVPYLTRHFGFSHFFMGTGLRQGLQQISEHLDEATQKFYEEALGFSGFALFLAGLALAIKKRQTLLLVVLSASALAFLLIVFKAGFAFYHHSYYIIPFAPVMALVAGYALTAISNQKLIALCLVAVALECVLKKNSDFYIKENHQAILNLETDLDKFSHRSDLIAINSGEVPTPMYFAHRKGWVESNEKLAEGNYVESLKRKGLKYIVILKKCFGSDLQLPYKIAIDTADYRIYQLF